MTDVVIAAGAAGRDDVLAGSAPGRVAFVAQPGPPAELAQRIAAGIPGAELAATLPDGEEAKSIAVVEDLWRHFARLGLDRADLVVGVGGGALLDVAGFAAATYLRGVAAVYVPTTLLAAVDAAIGGKTGINLEAKNQVGAFRHPERVIVDIEVLAELPEDLMRQGRAEALKAGLVGDPELVGIFEHDGVGADLEEVVTRAIEVKAGIVAGDFTESGIRAHLNYGHTVGHALEVAAGMRHGDAVAVGMVAAGRVSAMVAGFDAEDRQRQIISSLGLPVTAPAVGAVEVRDLIAFDKKRAGGETRFVVLEGIGRPRVAVVDAATVDAALAAIGIGD